VLLGEITIEREQEIVQMTKLYIENNIQRIPALKEYYDNWGDWEPWP
jgi:hypothetical protein